MDHAWVSKSGAFVIRQVRLCRGRQARASRAAYVAPTEEHVVALTSDFPRIFSGENAGKRASRLFYRARAPRNAAAPRPFRGTCDALRFAAAISTASSIMTLELPRSASRCSKFAATDSLASTPISAKSERRTHHLLHLGGERFEIALLHQHSAASFLDRLGNSSVPRREHRHAGGHRFEDGIRNSFLVFIRRHFARVQETMAAADKARADSAWERNPRK